MAIVGQTGAGLIVSGSDGVVKISGGSSAESRSVMITGSSDITVVTSGSSTYTFPSQTTTLVGTDVTQSISNKDSIHMASQNPLPTGVAGMLSVSSSGATEKLYFFNGSAWQEVSFV